MHLLHDPQAFAERLFSRLAGCNERYETRLAVLAVLSRLVGVHKLLARRAPGAAAAAAAGEGERRLAGGAWRALAGAPSRRPSLTDLRTLKCLPLLTLSLLHAYTTIHPSIQHLTYTSVQVLPLYPYLQKYVQPHQRDATVILSALARCPRPCCASLPAAARPHRRIPSLPLPAPPPLADPSAPRCFSPPFLSHARRALTTSPSFSPPPPSLPPPIHNPPPPHHHHHQAAQVQSTHELVPPDVLAPVLRQLVDHFVHDRARPEVVTIGLKTVRTRARWRCVCGVGVVCVWWWWWGAWGGRTLDHRRRRPPTRPSPIHSPPPPSRRQRRRRRQVRELCLRAPLVMEGELLSDLALYKKYRDKEVRHGVYGGLYGSMGAV